MKNIFNGKGSIRALLLDAVGLLAMAVILTVVVAGLPVAVSVLQAVTVK